MASRSVNKVILIGNLGKDPELRYTSGGVAVASFSVATNESWKDPQGNAQERTQWHNIVAWKKLAEICGEYLKKGSKLYLEGRLQYRNYDDKNGVKRYVTEIVMDEMVMLDGRAAGTAASTPDVGGAPAQDEPGGKIDDLPF
ncbi:MAG: ssDNA-binding protein [Bacteroidetes bacterium]|jgi:single-strand DNA-binding protein|nr:ssDNA-binding protein [Bacteroidota bacterium]MDP2884000.1 single-stranded DNA-binding protein [Ignavibacteria bacterium]